MTGIIDIYDHLIEQSGAIIEIKNGILGKKWIQTSKINLQEIGIINDKFFIKKASTLVPKDKKDETIVTPLDTIDHVSVL